MAIPKKPHHHVQLNTQFRVDLWWWKSFAARWNGVAIFPSVTPPSVTVTSDALGHWGCGAWCGHDLFQFEWPEAARHHHISFKELFAVLVACTVWGPGWKGKWVRWRCDNQAAVGAVASRSCRDKSMMQLTRCLFFLEACCQFELMTEYLPGDQSALADDLSRNGLLPSSSRH